MLIRLIFLLLLFNLSNAIGQNVWYLSQQSGSDTNNGLSSASPFHTMEYAKTFLEPGDTLLLMGEFKNPSFDPNYEFSEDINDPYIWTQENTLLINNLNGEPGQYITIKAKDESTILKGSGANIFRMFNCSYLRVEGFEIYGEVDNIPLSTAEALQFLYKDSNGVVHYRVQPGTPPEEVENMTFPVLENIKRPSFTDTRGFYLSNAHHVDVINNLVHHTPGNGLRVAHSDYINVIGNEVHNTSRKSYSGTHGLVLSNSNSIDNNNVAKIFILRNKVHHNFNEIYSWAPSKTIITPKIDEGKGISLQRNDSANTWTHGRILVQNNLTYFNGYSGLHSNGGRAIDIINNTSYFDSFTGAGSNHGISLQSSEDVLIANNIVMNDVSVEGFGIATSSSSSNYLVKNNLVAGTIDQDVDAIDESTTLADPLFVDPGNFDFNLMEGSPAIGAANITYAPEIDFTGMPRFNEPDLGALESSFLTSSININDQNKFSVFPNPFNDFLFIEGEIKIENLRILNILGQDKTTSVNLSLNGDQWHLNTSNLDSGIYILMIKNKSFFLRKIQNNF